MSTSSADEQSEQGISDDQLPEDLQPTDDNPLAQPLPDDALDPEELDVLGGRPAEQGDQQGDREDRHEPDGADHTAG
ncbi:hypothetical protein [Nocardioides taihuensis]|uniref:Sugar ABC transporter ATPase n=1 Tax=Nocardioides taihuensis TaxID=1835606 RepID=A0ABW0BNS0_9ACTN